jgi:hypothetical protein
MCPKIFMVLMQVNLVSGEHIKREMLIRGEYFLLHCNTLLCGKMFYAVMSSPCFGVGNFWRKKVKMYLKGEISEKVWMRKQTIYVQDRSQWDGYTQWKHDGQGYV